jgi:acyl-CoA synthetase (AMP-forming)/AMP-acid ligase II/acyl carrier protein
VMSPEVNNFAHQILSSLQSTSANKSLLQGQINLSYGQTLDKVMALHAYWQSRGLVAGDRIAVCTHRADVLIDSLLASLTYGTNITVLNPELGKRFLVSMAKFVEPTLVIIDAQNLDALTAEGLNCLAVENQPIPKAQLSSRVFGKIISSFRSAPKDIEDLKEKADFDAALASIEPKLCLHNGNSDNKGERDATALMLFTSGTTSQPKAVQLSFRNLQAQLNTFMKVYGYNENSQILNVLPLHHTDGICNGVLAAVVSQSCLHRPFDFSIPRLPDLMAYLFRERISHFIAVPSILSLIQRLGPELDDSFSSPEFAFVISSADLLPEPLWRQFSERFKVKVVNCYGLTETVCMATYCGPNNHNFKLGTIGMPVDCEVKLDEISTDGVGELCIRGTNVMQGYFRQPELSAQVIKDGWFHTGDLAAIDSDGFVRIVGRKKTLIIVAGRNVHPENVAHELLHHPQVAEAYAFGVADPTWGQTIACAIVPKTGEVLELINVQQFAREHLPSAMMPTHYEIMDALPRNASGKVMVETLKQLVEQSVTDSNSDLALPNLLIELETSVVRLASRVFQVPESELSLNSRYQEAPGWDSLSHVALMCALESHFKITLKPRDILSIQTLHDAHQTVKNHASKRQPLVAEMRF